MPREDTGAPRERCWAWLRLLALAVVLGTLLGILNASRVVLANRYVSLGFWRTSAQILFGSLWYYQVGALVVTAVLVLLWRLLPRKQPPAGCLGLLAYPARAIRCLNARLLGIATGVCLLLTLGAAVSVFIASGKVTAANPRSVILIGVDTLRLDSTSLWGANRNGRDTTPNLRALAERGVAFREAISQAPWTMPAFASVLTGLYPHEHGAYSLSGYLPPENVTLAEVLREAGYATGGVVSHLFVDERHGFSQGIDLFNEDNSLGHEAITSENVTDLAISYIAGHREEPFFLFVHYFDPHYEWHDHEDWDFSDPYTGWLREDEPNIGNLRRQRHRLLPADIAFLQDLYDEEIAYTDHHIGRLLDFLRQEGLDAESAVIVVADHGEEFLERGWLGHTTSLYDELIRVPLICVLPGATENPRTVDGVVETRGVFGLVLDYLGVEWPSKTLGPPLLAQPGKPSASGEAYSSVWLPDAPLPSGKRVRLSSVRTSDWKLVEDHTRGLPMLFDLQHDPDERVNRFEAEATQGAILEDHLGAWLKAVNASDAQAVRRRVDAQQMEELEALGYL